MPKFELEEEVKNEVLIAKKYKVVLHNNNTTPFEVVEDILMDVFKRTESEAEAIAMNVHVLGKGIAGTYAKDIAVAKSHKAMKYAQEEGFPELLFTVEEE
jgi:ATP-dependent Clp protease adaptor protein ClpS